MTADARFTRDRAGATLLAENLIQRCVLALHNGEGLGGLSRHSRLLNLFVRFHRRHVRLNNLAEDGVEDGLRDGALLERVVATMPLEWREALLLVSLERLSHAEAAAVLEIPLAALVDRLARARAALSQAMAAPVNAARRVGAPHLRLIK